MFRMLGRNVVSRHNSGHSEFMWRLSFKSNDPIGFGPEAGASYNIKCLINILNLVHCGSRRVLRVRCQQCQYRSQMQPHARYSANVHCASK